MILGIDLGSSAVKLAVLEGREVLHTAYIPYRGRSAEELVASRIERWQLRAQAIAETGVGAAVFDTGALGLSCPVSRMLEVSAITAGTALLTGCEENLTVSIGTGTAFVLTKDGSSRHIGGSAFGGGALNSLFKKIVGYGLEDLRAAQLCSQGDITKVDMLMRELPSCPPSLDPSFTAANLVKTDESTGPADWAIGLLNMTVQTIGSMAYLTACGAGVDNIVFTGGPTAIPETRAILGDFTRAYGKNFIVPQNSQCATAIGAAYLCQRWE